MAPSIFSPFLTKKPTKTAPLILHIEKSFQTKPKWHILKKDTCKYNSWFSTCTHARTGLRNVTDVTTVLIQHPAKVHRNPQGSQGLAQASISQRKLGGRNRNRAHSPENFQLWHVNLTMHLKMTVFLRRTRAQQQYKVAFNLYSLQRHELNPGFLRDPLQ